MNSARSLAERWFCISRSPNKNNLAIWRDQRPWRLGWGELTDELTVGRQRAAARPSGQGILALPDRRAAVVLSPCALGHEFFSCAAAGKLRMSFGALHGAHVWPRHLKG
jgi:hypothetical protein